MSDEAGTALLVTSHDMREVERLCERVIFLSKGRIEADGTPAEVARRYDSVDLEGVFLHLAARPAGSRHLAADQQTDHP
jgi:ABC-2 type transport system ATP-binding protein